MGRPQRSYSLLHMQDREHDTEGLQKEKQGKEEGRGHGRGGTSKEKGRARKVGGEEGEDGG